MCSDLLNATIQCLTNIKQFIALNLNSKLFKKRKLLRKKMAQLLKVPDNLTSILGEPHSKRVALDPAMSADFHRHAVAHI